MSRFLPNLLVHLINLEIIDPHDTALGHVAFSPEQRLLVGLINRTILDLSHPDLAVQGEAFAWLLDRAVPEPGLRASYVFEALGLDPERILRRLSDYDSLAEFVRRFGDARQFALSFRGREILHLFASYTPESGPSLAHQALDHYQALRRQSIPRRHYKLIH